MRVRLAVLCDKVIVDVRTNRVTIINVADGMAIAQFPYIYMSPEFLMLVDKDIGDPDQFEGSVQFLLDDAEIFDGPFTAVFQGGNHARVVAQIGQIIISHPGVLRAKVKAGDRQIGGWECQMDLLGEPSFRELL